MNWLRTYWPVAILVLLMLAVIDGTLSSLFTCHPVGAITGGGADRRPTQEECTALHGPVLVSLTWLLNGLHKYDGVVTGLFTIVLAMFTGRLWYSTDKLWGATVALVKGAEDTARRQLRAYITIKDAVVLITSETECRVILKFVNSGQTPAYNFMCWNKVVIGPMEGKLPWDNSGKHTGAASITGAGAANFAAIDIRVTPEQKKAIETEQLAFFVWGRAVYQDAFETPRFLHFRLGATGLSLTVEAEFLKGLGWPLTPAGYYTDEYEQPKP